MVSERQELSTGLMENVSCPLCDSMKESVGVIERKSEWEQEETKVVA